jgi:hypothetical protein
MNELRTLFPIQIVRGAFLRPDGVAVGLVNGGAPSWDLLSLSARSQAGSDYHRLLLALDAPIDVYLVDQPPDIAREISTLLDRQAQVDQPLLANVLSEMVDYLAELSSQSGSRAKQVIWAVNTTRSESVRSVGGLAIGRLVQRDPPGTTAAATRAGGVALAQALEKARRLADALSQLGGTPVPRLLEAEEIARLLYGLADPMRAHRYPLAGTLLDRVRRVITPSQPLERLR